MRLEEVPQSGPEVLADEPFFFITHRIHGAGIYANMTGVY